MRRISATYDHQTTGEGGVALHLVIEVEGAYSHASLEDPGDYPEGTITAIMVASGDYVPEEVWDLVLLPSAQDRAIEACIEQALADDANEEEEER